jgi:hypothetical protein
MMRPAKIIAFEMSGADIPVYPRRRQPALFIARTGMSAPPICKEIYPALH